MGQEILQEILVNAAAAHFHHRVLGARRHGVLEEKTFVIQQPVLGPPSVHDDPTTSFVDGLAPQQ